MNRFILATDLSKTTQILTAQLRNALDANDLAVAQPFLTALETGNAWFERENWHDIHAREISNATVRGEFLLRAKDENGDHIDLAPVFQIVQRQCLYPCFDQLIVLHAAAQALRQTTFPITINISARNACDGEALSNLHTQLEQHFGDTILPRDITFELLEDDVAHNPDHDALMAIKAHGYTFAIDDASHEQSDHARLRNLGPYADYVKIDGKTLRFAKNGQLSLAAFAEELLAIAPQAELVCEWIDSAEEAADLRTTMPGIRYVQGRALVFAAQDFLTRMGAADSSKFSRFLIGPPVPPLVPDVK